MPLSHGDCAEGSSQSPQSPQSQYACSLLKQQLDKANDECAALRKECEPLRNDCAALRNECAALRQAAVQQEALALQREARNNKVRDDCFVFHHTLPVSQSCSCAPGQLVTG